MTNRARRVLWHPTQAKTGLEWGTRQLRSLESLHPSQSRSGRAHCRSLGCPGFPAKVVASRTPCGFPYRKPHTLLSLAPRTGNSGALGMQKRDGSAHLSSCYKGWRELYAEREANDPSIHITNRRGRNKSTLCHPDRSAAEWRDLQFPFLTPKALATHHHDCVREHNQPESFPGRSAHPGAPRPQEDS